MNLFKELVKRYGIGFVLGAATLDGYRRQILNDKNNRALDQIKKETDKLNQAQKELYDNSIADELEKTKTNVGFMNYRLVADEHKKYADKYNSNPNSFNKQELDKSNVKLEASFEEIKKLDISEYLTSLYNRYMEFLATLTPDKIVALFNLIIGGLTLSSFMSVLSIMLSENIINKMVFLEKLPRILKLLRLRNNINKRVSKFYLLMHLVIILLGILGNLFMFFI